MRGRHRGSGVSFAAPGRRGVTVLEVLVCTAIAAILAGLTFAALTKARAAARRVECANNAKQLALASHTYSGRTGFFPAGTVTQPPGKLFSAWTAHLLAELGETALAKDRDADYSRQWYFGGKTPHANLARPLKVVLCPAGDKTVVVNDENVTAGVTYFLGVSGARPRDRAGILFPDAAVRPTDLKDGASNTVLFGERPPSANDHFGWWYAGAGMQFDGTADHHLPAVGFNYTFRAPHCSRGPYPFHSGDSSDDCSIFHFFSEHAGGAHFAFADGSVRFLNYSAKDVLPALATRAGGETAAIP
jgi:prepilin-type N-terminal cleavage/methylation domain-containing protein/prepilin-type processing-associated H-X9-DG protein